MEATPNEMIPFPDPNDPGNGALDLQLLAERVDLLAQAQQAELKRIINKPGRVLRLSANTAGIASGVTQDLMALGAWLPVFDSSLPTSLTTYGFSNAGLGTTPGIYRIGAYLNVSITGALTANSLRQTGIYAAVPSDATVFPATVSTKAAYSINYDPTGNLGQYTELEVYTPFPSHPLSVFGGTRYSLLFNHLNAASTVVVNAGSYAWIYRVADVRLI